MPAYLSDTPFDGVPYVSADEMSSRVLFASGVFLTHVLEVFLFWLVWRRRKVPVLRQFVPGLAPYMFVTVLLGYGSAMFNYFVFPAEWFGNQCWLSNIFLYWVCACSFQVILLYFAHITYASYVDRSPRLYMLPFAIQMTLALAIGVLFTVLSLDPMSNTIVYMIQLPLSKYKYFSSMDFGPSSPDVFQIRVCRLPTDRVVFIRGLMFAFAGSFLVTTFIVALTLRRHARTFPWKYWKINSSHGDGDLVEEEEAAAQVAGALDAPQIRTAQVTRVIGERAEMVLSIRITIVQFLLRLSILIASLVYTALPVSSYPPNGIIFARFFYFSNFFCVPVLPILYIAYSKSRRAMLQGQNLVISASQASDDRGLSKDAIQARAHAMGVSTPDYLRATLATDRLRDMALNSVIERNIQLKKRRRPPPQTGQLDDDAETEDAADGDRLLVAVDGTPSMVTLAHSIRRWYEHFYEGDDDDESSAVSLFNKGLLPCVDIYDKDEGRVDALLASVTTTTTEAAPAPAATTGHRGSLFSLLSSPSYMSLLSTADQPLLLSPASTSALCLPTTVYVNWCRGGIRAFPSDHALFRGELFRQVHRLELIGNGLTRVPAAELVACMPGLRVLILAENRLGGDDVDVDVDVNTAVPSELAGLTVLHTLDLRANGLRSIPRVVRRLSSSLTTLSLAANPLGLLPANSNNDDDDEETLRTLSAHNRLVELDLSDTALAATLTSALLPASLQALFLSRNRCKCLPDDIFARTHGLRTLWLDSNGISVLPESLTRLMALEDLNLSDNKLHWLPSNIPSLGHLRKLLIASNPTLDIPASVFQTSMPLLEQLDMRDLHINAVPSDSLTMAHMRKLSLEGNMLSTGIMVPDWQFLGLRKALGNTDYIVLGLLASSVLIRVILGTLTAWLDDRNDYSSYIFFDVLAAFEVALCMVFSIYITAKPNLLSCMEPGWIYKVRSKLAFVDSAATHAVADARRFAGRRREVRLTFSNVITISLLFVNAVQICDMVFPDVSSNSYLTGVPISNILGFFNVMDQSTEYAVKLAMFIASAVVSLILRAVIEMRAHFNDLGEIDFLVSTLSQALLLGMGMNLMEINVCSRNSISGLIEAPFHYPSNGMAIVCYSPEHTVMVLIASAAFVSTIFVSIIFPCYWQTRFPQLDVVYHPKPMVFSTILRRIISLLYVFPMIRSNSVVSGLLFTTLATSMIVLVRFQKPCVVDFVNELTVIMYSAVVMCGVLSVGIQVASASMDLFLILAAVVWSIALLCCVYVIVRRNTIVDVQESPHYMQPLPTETPEDESTRESTIELNVFGQY